MLILIIFASCEKIIPFDGEITKSKLVVNSTFFNDSTWKVHISSSRSILDSNSYKNIEDCTIAIKDDNGNIIETLTHEKNGFYNGLEIPVDNQNYFLEVINENFNSVTSSNYIPSSININSTDTSSYITNEKERIKITLSFNDPEEENYYKIGVKIRKTIIDTTVDINGNISYDSSLSENWIKIYRDSDILERTISNKEVIFNDLTFTQSNSTIEFSIKDVIKKYNETEYKNLEFVKVYFYNINKSLYNYHQSLKTYDDVNNIPFAQPVQVYSNIENGFGVFSGANIQVIQLY